jgi:uncharacterized protein (DUF2235 family)
METLGNKIDDNKSTNVFYCMICDYNTCHKGHYNEHLNSVKHTKRKQMETSRNKIVDDKTICCQTLLQKEKYQCDKCNKVYKNRSGLWKHSKNCLSCDVLPHQHDEFKFNGMDKDDLIIMLLKQNADLIKGQQDMTMEIVKNGTNNTTNNNNNNNTTHTNSHNKAFNLNFFLNETCKNAMNINDFVDSIKLQLSDFMEVGEAGYVKGISNIIVKKLNALDETVRPIHCTDQKRETFYVKDENKWEKEEEDFKRIRRMIKRVTDKNERLMMTYKEKYPDYNEYDSKRSDQYSMFVIEALGGAGDDTKEKENKIINHISKATTIKNKAK